MKNKKLSFRELAEDFVRDMSWQKYINGQGTVPDEPIKLLTLVAQYLFYTGDLHHAKEVGYLGSKHLEERAESCFSNGYMTFGVMDLFDCALYRSLSGRKDEAMDLYREVIKIRSRISVQEAFREKRAKILIYEAYAHFRLGQYDKVFGLTQKGLDGLRRGKSRESAPEQNTRTYRLAPLLDKLAAYCISPSPGIQKEAQDSLALYKQENFLYVRLGYDIIFDLQLSYPDILQPVLPGSNPEED